MDIYADAKLDALTECVPLRREMGEILASQRKMLERRGETASAFLQCGRLIDTVVPYQRVLAYITGTVG